MKVCAATGAPSSREDTRNSPVSRVRYSGSGKLACRVEVERKRGAHVGDS